MTKNFLVFLFGLFLLMAFSFLFAYVAIYSENLPAGIISIVGFLACLIISIMIGIWSRDEGGALYVYYFVIAGVSAVVFIWYLSRAGTLLKVW